VPVIPAPSAQGAAADLQAECASKYGSFTLFTGDASSRGTKSGKQFAGQHTWCLPSISGTRCTLQRFVVCKAQWPHTTSAIFVLPILEHHRWWRQATKHMKLVRKLKRAEVELLQPGHGSSGLRFGVFWSPPEAEERFGSTAAEQSAVAGETETTKPAADAAQRVYEVSQCECDVEAECEPTCSPDQVASAGVVCGCEGDHIRLRLDHQLILLPIRLLGVSCVALVDCGATHDAVDGPFAEKQGWTLSEGQVKRVKLANGRHAKAQGVLRNAQFIAGGVSMSSEFVAMPMGGEEFQVILGKQWLTRMNPHIDWSANKVTIGGIEIPAIGAKSTKPREVKVCSLRNVLKAARKRNARSWCVLVRDISDADTSAQGEAGVNAAAGYAQPAKPSYTPYNPSLKQPDWEKVGSDLKGKPALLKVLREYAQVFEPLPDGPPPMGRPKHSIDLEEGAKPPYKPPYRMSPLELDELKKQIQGLLDKGWIRPSHSPYGSPVLFAAKPDGSLRLCIDYRALNAVTRKSRYPIPRIDEMFDRLNKAKYITCLDYQQGYHQVGMREADIEKTAFVTRYGQYEWLVMPFGLCNAPSTFQAIMNQILGSDFDDFAMAYLDDVTIFSETLEEHVQHVASVLKRLKERGYRLRLSKCKFALPEVELLGFVVGKGQLKPSPKKVEVVRAWATPTNAHELRQFLGFCNFYRRFVHGYSKIAAPLTGMFKKDIAFSWSEAHESAFRELKRALTTAPTLQLPDMSLPFRVVVDASDFALGATLLQDHGKGWQPVAFDGRKMTSAELNYTTTDKENLGLVHAMLNWRCYFEGRKVTVVTDHHSLIHLQTQPHLNRRQARWLELLANFELEIIHRPGTQNCSDALSRLRYPEPSADTVALVYALAVSTGLLDADFLEKCRQGYASDSYYEQLSKKRHKVRHTAFTLNDGLWYLGDRLCIPSDDGIKAIIFQELHDSVTGGHLGYAKTLESISRRFFWPGMQSDVKLYVKTCPTCQRSKHVNQRPAGLQQSIPTPKSAWEQVTLDLLTSLPVTKDGHNAAVVFVDRLTKMLHWEPCTVNVTAEGVAKLYLQSVVRYHGFARKLISDRDPRFVAGFWQELQKLLGTRVNMSTADHPQSDGQTENANKTLLQLLRCFASDNPSNWDQLLAMAELSYNSHVQMSTGKSPFYANYGRHPTMPVDLKQAERERVEDLLLNIHTAVKEVKLKLAESQQRQRSQANKRRRDVQYHVGDRVLVSSSIFKLKNPEHKKLIPPYMGPFAVSKVCGPVDVKLELPAQLRTHRVVHVSKIRPFYETGRFGERGAQPSIVLVDGEPEYEVEALLARKIVRGNAKYLVKWLGLDHCENMWIRRDFLDNAMDLVREFEAHSPLPGQ
jgi:RNase H-like domain found in reverse transcriptase/Reverse transcriptase (RNA-dependent DNA polymerase)/Integrase zinc binding domain/Chromo (CHRromatin Organisation MOdifier) domain